MVPTVDIRIAFYLFKFLILAYDDRKVRLFHGTGCQSYEKVKIIIAPTYDDSKTKIALWKDNLDNNYTNTANLKSHLISIWY